jgi:carbamoyl-phosphate synthase small subunit
VEGLVLREISWVSSSWRSEGTLNDYLENHGIVGISEIDTRAVVRQIRTKGALRGVISSIDLDEPRLVARAREIPGMAGLDLASSVSCTAAYRRDLPASRSGLRTFRVVAYDFGIKGSILKRLVRAGCSVTVVPAQTKAEDVLDLHPDGIFLSNGPGDPEPIRYAVENTRRLLGRIPIFGVCLGHQLMGLALGGRTYKLKFGHRGGNHPVKNLVSGQVEITAHNHGFAVDAESLNQGVIELTHINLNDQTLEGIRHRSLPAFSVQYHPEASPGPHDSHYLFEDFTRLMADQGR